MNKTLEKILEPVLLIGMTGFLLVMFGIFTVEGVPNMCLGRFKENFGASGIFRDTFQITL